MRTFDERRKSVETHIHRIQIHKKRKRVALIAACLVLVLSVLTVDLLRPFDTTPPDVSMYESSEYYTLIQRINTCTYQPPKYKNKLHAILGVLSGLGKKEANMMPQPGSPDIFVEFMPGNPEGGPKYEYVEVTDNQVAGVIEADIFKRSDQYVFYLRGGKLAVYDIAREDSHLVSTFTLDLSWNEFTSAASFTTADMYLSQDCRTITVLMQGYHKTLEAVTSLVTLDVSDPGNIRQTGCIFFKGSYLSSRVVDGDILLSYNYSFRLSNVDFDDPTTFVPQYGTLEQMKCIPGDAIICPDDISSGRYTVVCKLDGKSLDVLGAVALLGYSEELYVSQNSIYATRSYNRGVDTEDGRYCQRAMTEITGISYTGETLQILGSIQLEGSIKDQYSMDEYEGILRVVTSTDTSYYRESFTNAFVSSAFLGRERNANLYCVDLDAWMVTAEVIAFAPEGEDAQSVRFEGDKAYVCTAEVITLKDPVYFFDLSDLDNITWTDTGTIDGYSTSLIQFGDGYLVGIGVGENRNLKIEVYAEDGEKVVSISAYERNAWYMEEYKSYLIDRERQIIGLTVVDQDTNAPEYVLLHFDGDELRPVYTCDLLLNSPANTRAFLADGWIYILTDSHNGIYVQQISE